MKNIVSTKILYRDIESLSISKTAVLVPSNICEDFKKHLVNIIGNNIKSVVEDIIKTNLIFCYYLSKDFHYSHKIVDTKISNVRYSVKKKSTVKFQVGDYDPKEDLNIHILINLLINSKKEIFNAIKKDNKKKLKLVNDILTITLLLGDITDTTIDFKAKDFVFNNDYNIEENLGNYLLDNGIKR